MGTKINTILIKLLFENKILHIHGIDIPGMLSFENNGLIK